jgi:hypothetical protein
VLRQPLDGAGVDRPRLAAVLVTRRHVGHCGAVDDHVGRKVLKDPSNVVRLGHVEGRIAARAVLEPRRVIPGGGQHVVLAILAEAPDEGLAEQSVGTGNEDTIEQHGKSPRGQGSRR